LIAVQEGKETVSISPGDSSSHAQELPESTWSRTRTKRLDLMSHQC
jgi:hypothetical protein